jgi:hypothetical protein
MVRHRPSLMMLSLLFGCSVLLTAAPRVAAEGAASLATPARHWAAGAVDNLVARLAWSAPTDLDAPIPRDEWRRLVSKMLGQQPDLEREKWVWDYTGGLSGEEFVVRREDAFGGLMKLATVFRGEKAHTADPSGLAPYGDGVRVADHQRVLVAGALKHGLVTGYPGGLLHPKRPLAYGEAAVLVDRFLARYGGPTKAWMEPQAGEWPRPRPFASGMAPLFPIDQVIHTGFSVGSAGTAWLVINGAAWAPELPGLGAAPAGQVWVAVDTEIYNWEKTELTIAPGTLRFRLQDSWAKVNIETAANPFAAGTVVLKQRGSVRGLVVFAVPAGMQGMWFQCESKLGFAPGKGDGYNGASRGFLGNLPKATQ